MLESNLPEDSISLLRFVLNACQYPGITMVARGQVARVAISSSSSSIRQRGLVGQREASHDQLAGCNLDGPSKPLSHFMGLCDDGVL